jgi:hypothetical protein
MAAKPHKPLEFRRDLIGFIHLLQQRTKPAFKVHQVYFGGLRTLVENIFRD